VIIMAVPHVTGMWKDVLRIHIDLKHDENDDNLS
jgi:hypothetical protein